MVTTWSEVGGRGQVEQIGGPWQRRVFVFASRTEIHERHSRFVSLDLDTTTIDTFHAHTIQTHTMEAPTKPTTSSLFEVYLRLRPSFAPNAERFLDVDAADDKAAPTHITIHAPAHDQRRKAVETFKFTRVFEEEATQLDLFHGTGLDSMMQGVLGAEGREGRDGLFATLGVTGSGKV
jgi:hypothetical protein